MMRLKSNRLGIHVVRDSLSPEAKAVVKYLGLLGGKSGFVLGQHFRAAKRTAEGASAELLAMQSRYGVQPAFLGWEYITRAASVDLNDYGRSILTAHANAGGICSIHCHLSNFVTGQNAYDRIRDSTSAVDALLSAATSSAAKTAWLAWLSDLADTLDALVDSQGRKIPVIVRLFHEANAWINWKINDGPSGANQIEWRNFTSMSSNGSQVTATVETRATSGFDFSMGNGSYMQVSDAVPSSFNGQYSIVACVPSGDQKGVSSTFTLVRSNAASIPAGTASAPGRCYHVDGFWWAGRDRSAAMCALFADAFNYLVTTRGCTHAIFASAPMTWDGLAKFATFDDLQVNASGLADYGYGNWYPGHQYVDVWGYDYYRFSSAPGADFGIDRLAKSIGGVYGPGSIKPYFAYELGLQAGGNFATEPGWTEAGAWDTVLSALKNKHTSTAGISFWDERFFPDTAAAASPSFARLVSDPGCITLAKIPDLY